MRPMRQLQRQCAVPNLEASTIENKHDSIAKTSTNHDNMFGRVSVVDERKHMETLCCHESPFHHEWCKVPNTVVYFSSKGRPRRHFPGVSSALVFSGLITVLQRPHRCSKVSSLFYGQINVLRIRIFLWICTSTGCKHLRNSPRTCVTGNIFWQMCFSWKSIHPNLETDRCSENIVFFSTTWWVVVCASGVYGWNMPTIQM